MSARQTQGKSTESLIYPARIDSISQPRFVSMLVAIAIGTGVTTMGNAFKCGAFLGTLLCSIVAAFTWYSLNLYLKCVDYWKVTTFDELWTHTVGKTTKPVVTVLCVPLFVVVLNFYCRSMYAQLSSFLVKIFNPVPDILQNNLFLGMIVLVLLIPFIVCANPRIITSVFMFKVGIIGVMLVIIIYSFVSITVDNGFDPGNEVKFFSFDDSAISSITSLLTAYLCFPLGFPNLRHVADCSFRTLRKGVTWFILITWFAYCCFGLFEYLTFFDGLDSSSILDQYPSSVLIDIARVIIVVILYISFLGVMNITRFLTTITFIPAHDIPAHVWTAMGFIVIIVAIALSNLSGLSVTAMGVIADFLAPNVLFTFPGFFYMMTFKLKNIFHFIGAFLIFALGVGCSLWLMITDIQNA